MTHPRLLALTAATAASAALLTPTAALAAQPEGTSVSYTEARVQLNVNGYSFFARVRDFGDRTTVEGQHQAFHGCDATNTCTYDRYFVGSPAEPGTPEVTRVTLAGSQLTADKKLSSGSFRVVVPVVFERRVAGGAPYASTTTTTVQDETVEAVLTVRDRGLRLKDGGTTSHSDGTCTYEERYAVEQDITATAFARSVQSTGDPSDASFLSRVTQTTFPC